MRVCGWGIFCCCVGQISFGKEETRKSFFLFIGISPLARNTFFLPHLEQISFGKLSTWYRKLSLFEKSPLALGYKALLCGQISFGIKDSRCKLALHLLSLKFPLVSSIRLYQFCLARSVSCTCAILLGESNLCSVASTPNFISILRRLQSER